MAKVEEEKDKKVLPTPDTPNVSDEYEIIKGPLRDLSEAGEEPARTAYTNNFDTLKQYAPKVLSQEERDKRLRGARAVQGISHLSNAMAALANVFASRGGISATIPQMGTAPISAWIKEQDAKELQAGKLAAQAQQQDHAEWKTDYTNWLARRKAIQTHNDKVESDYAKALNDALAAGKKVKAQADAQVQKHKDALEMQAQKHKDALEMQAQKRKDTKTQTPEEKEAKKQAITNEYNKLVDSGEMPAIRKGNVRDPNPSVEAMEGALRQFKSRQSHQSTTGNTAERSAGSTSGNAGSGGNGGHSHSATSSFFNKKK